MPDYDDLRLKYNYGSLENPPYYVTAYGIAVKHGYQGTEEEWIHEIQESAHDSSIAAAESAEAAAGSADTAEAFGAGTRGGEPLEEDDPAYHNNAQYYSANADTKAAAAADSAEDSEAYAIGKRSGVDVDSDDPAYENNSKYYSDLAKDYAEDTGGLVTSTVTGWLADNVDPETGYVLDRSLQVPNAAAPADLVGELKSALQAAIGNEIIDITWGYYITTNGSTVNINSPTVSTTGWGYAVVDAAEGDMFTVNSPGASTIRAWCFIDASGNSLSVAGANVAAVDKVIVAPVNSAKLVINTKSTSKPSFRGRYIKDDVQQTMSSQAYDEYLINGGSYTIKASDLESGQWGYSSKVANAARARTKFLMPVRAGMQISYESTTYDVYFGVLETLNSGDYIQSPGWKTDGSGTVNITKDGYLTFIVRNHADTTATVNPADYNGVVTIKTLTYGAMRLLETPVSTYSSHGDIFDIPTERYFTATGSQIKAMMSVDETDNTLINAPVGLKNARNYIVSLRRYAGDYRLCTIEDIISGILYVGRTNMASSDWFAWVDSPYTRALTASEVAELISIFDVTPGQYFTATGSKLTEIIADAPALTDNAAYLVLTWQYATSYMYCEIISSTRHYRGNTAMSHPDTFNWQDVQSSGGNDYYTSYFQNTYNITCSPSITTDTNNYLASTGDTTDRTGDIQSMLNTTGVCRLGPGKYYVSGIEVPNFGLLTGCGDATVLRLKDQDTPGDEQYAYAVKLKTQSTVSNMRIEGADAPTTPQDVSQTERNLLWTKDTVDANHMPKGKRHGVVFEGNVVDSSGGQTYYRARVVNCDITLFTGGGITCNKTGLSPVAHLFALGCNIYVCGVGINIPFYSEFNQFVNCASQYNYYGCVNNGGNNIFTSCDFSHSRVAILIDNSTNQSTNNTHGAYFGCKTSHPYSHDGVLNGGIAVRILKGSHGEHFVYTTLSQPVEIDGSYGIRFIGCQLGVTYGRLTITNSKAVTFTDCNIGAAGTPTLVQSGNVGLEFVRCYKTDGTLYDPVPTTPHIPLAPTTDGEYVLTASVSGGVATCAWTSAS